MVCLAFLAFGGAIGVGDQSLREILRHWFILGLVALIAIVLKSRQWSGGRWVSAAAAVTIAYLLATAIQDAAIVAQWLGHTAIGLAGLAVFAGDMRRGLSGGGKALLWGGCGWALAQLAFYGDALGARPDWVASWGLPVFIAESIVLYEVCTAVSEADGWRGIQKPLAYLLCYGLLAGGVVGLGRIGLVHYHWQKAYENFVAGDYAAGQRHGLALAPIETGLRYGPLSLNALLGELHLRFARGPIAALASCGEMAVAGGLPDSAAVFYEAAIGFDPTRSDLSAQLAYVRFGQGDTAEALDMVNRLLRDRPGDRDLLLARGVIYARIGKWPEALAALAAGDWTAEVARAFKAEELRGEIGQLPSRLYALVGDKLSFYEVVKLLQLHGVSVVHPAMPIGETGVVAAIDLQLTSGGGGSWPREAIHIGSTQVSLQRRGYNIVVIDPEEGTVSLSENFDTWENLAEGRRLARLLNGLPAGLVVAGTVRDEGSGAIKAPEVRDAMHRVGVGDFPRSWWSHAFVGVKGGQAGTALERLGNRTDVAIGALAANLSADSLANGELMREALHRRARVAAAGLAVYLAAWRAGAPLAVVRAE